MQNPAIMEFQLPPIDLRYRFPKVEETKEIELIHKSSGNSIQIAENSINVIIE
jgi:hypothetical protein